MEEVRLDPGWLQRAADDARRGMEALQAFVDYVERKKQKQESEADHDAR